MLFLLNVKICLERDFSLFLVWVAVHASWLLPGPISYTRFQFFFAWASAREMTQKGENSCPKQFAVNSKKWRLLPFLIFRPLWSCSPIDKLSSIHSPWKIWNNVYTFKSLCLCTIVLCKCEVFKVKFFWIAKFWPWPWSIFVILNLFKCKIEII